MERKSSSLNLMVVHPYPYEKDGANGVTRYIHELTVPLQRKGCDITIVAPHTDKPKLARHHELGVKIFSLKQSNTQYEASASLNIERAEAIQRKVKPDIIDVNEPMAAPNITWIFYLGSLIKGDWTTLPMYTATKHAQIEELTLFARGLSLLEKTLRGPLAVFLRMPRQGFKQAFGEIFQDRNVFISKATQESSPKIYGPYSQEGEVIYNGISTDELINTAKKRNRKDDGKFVMVAPGRHDPKKGHGDILTGYEIALPWFRENNIVPELILTSDGQRTEDHKKYVEKHRIPNVTFAHASSREAYLEILANADAGIVASRGGEGWNRVTAELRVMGLQVIATNINGQREAYGDPSIVGRMVNPADPLDISRGMIESASLSQEKRERRKEWGIKFVVDNFDVNEIARQKVLFYEKHLAKHRKPTEYDWRSLKRRPHVTDLFVRTFASKQRTRS